MKTKNKITPYLSIRDKLCTFTIINCEHHSLPWKLIGHTAVVYVCHETGQIMVFESTTLNKFTGKSGVQLTPMGLWVSKYPGKVFIRIPEFELSYSFSQQYFDACMLAKEFIREHLGTSYPDIKTRTGRFKLYLAALDFNLFGKDLFTYKGGDKGIFCTMLVVMLYQYCGLMCENISAQEFKPDDAKENGMMENWLKNCELGKEIRIK